MQSGGTNSVSSGTLYLGLNAGSYGTYNLSGNGLLTARGEIIGLSGTGSFTQSGGTNSVLSTGNLYVGYANRGTYNLSNSGLLSVSSAEYLGLVGSGTITQTGGTNSVSGILYVGYTNGGMYNLSGSALLIANGEYIGGAYEGPGNFTQSGGTNSTALFLGENSGSSGTYSLSGSGMLSGVLEIGASGTGSFTQSGGTNSAATYLGYSAGSSGTYNLSGSGLLSGLSVIGVAGTGSFTQTGGTNTVSAGLILAQSATSAATYNLNGGLLVLSASGIVSGSGAVKFNFGGGTLSAVGPWTSSLSMNLSGAGGPATVEVTGGSIGLFGILSGSGGLEKAGPGTLILSGSDSYTGGTYVNSGTLIVAAGSGLPDGTSLAVGAGATLIFDLPVAGSPVTDAAAGAAVPEPATLWLLMAGAAMLVMYYGRLTCFRSSLLRFGKSSC
jgi:autotransporter-associated beta strand protein